MPTNALSVVVVVTAPKKGAEKHMPGVYLEFQRLHGAIRAWVSCRSFKEMQER